ncbi:hypothetical protein STTU_2921 [Streptomyces sp. Tu6071]|nr:hypothetical protein STTU_2921 [Streptomyces sp. Tu6071]
MDPVADRLQDDLPVTATLVLFEAQHRDPRRSGVLCQAVKVGLCLFGSQQATEARAPHFDAAVPEGLSIVLRIAQATKVRVLDAGLGQGLPEAGLAEALLAADRGEPYVRYNTDVTVDERGDE